MKRSLIPLLCCPHCKGALSLVGSNEDGGEIESGNLKCSECQSRYPIASSIPRFVNSANYAGSFGLQWKRFPRTQLDGYNGTTISRDRFLRQTGWEPQSLAGAIVLDAGCGAGRFAEVALSLGANVVAVDYSEAVDVCWQNLCSNQKLNVLQADIRHLPFKQESFDFIYSFGVLQHTPDPRGSFLALPGLLKPNSQLAVDVYPRNWARLAHCKYWMRPVAALLSPPTLFKAVERTVPILMPISRAVARAPGLGIVLRRFVPVANYEGIQPLNEQQLYQWAVLDTFDWLSPRYDRPQTPQTLRSWLIEAGLEDVEVAKIAHLVGRGRKPSLAVEARLPIPTANVYAG